MTLTRQLQRSRSAPASSTSPLPAAPRASERRWAHPIPAVRGRPKPSPRVPRAADRSLGGAPAASSSLGGQCAGNLPGAGQGKREEKRRRRSGVSPGFGVRGQEAGLPKSGYPSSHPLQPEPLLPRLARCDSRHLHLIPYMLCRGRQGKCRDNMVVSILSHVAISISDVRVGGRRKCREVFFSFTSPALFSLQALAQGANRRTCPGCALLCQSCALLKGNVTCRQLGHPSSLTLKPSLASSSPVHVMLSQVSRNRR